MSDISININRYTELHQGIERARAKLVAVEPSLSADASNSLALPAFKHCVDELAGLVNAYAERIEADSQAIYQVGLQFMDQDDGLAKTYAGALASSLYGD